MERPSSGLGRRSVLGGSAGLLLSGLVPACAQAPEAASSSTSSAASGTSPTSETAPNAAALSGRLVQGGFAVGKTAPGTEIWLDGQARGISGSSGDYFIGFDRDAPAEAILSLRPQGQAAIETRLAIAPVTYETQSVSGLPQETVTPTDPKTLKRIAADTVLKNQAFQSLVDANWFDGGFVYPLETFTVTGHFGNQRILNGVPKSPHYGFDMAAPTGTPIYAPQQGVVVLAESDLFYEGGLTLIDHGQGVISMYLHQSRVDVKAGQTVQQGEPMGLVGARGRATGPHLCWRLKWRDRHLDPSLMVGRAAV